ncbi:4237_t:CDS:2, partial [Paraglomus occultum]
MGDKNVRKKRKRSKEETTSNSPSTKVAEINYHKPSAIAKPHASGRKYTVSVALPGSIVENAQSLELKTLLAGQESFAIFNVDEVVIFNESIHKTNRAVESPNTSDTSTDPNVFLARIFQYLETPQYLRKSLFPVHKDLQYAGLLNPLDCPHHVRQEEKSPFREGVVIEKKLPNGDGALVNAGLKKYVQIQRKVKPGVRVTLDMKDYTTQAKYYQALAVSPKTPREVAGLYWGYDIRMADSISKVFTHCPYPGGYDVTIGTSERGRSIDDVLSGIPEFNHLLVVFGGLGGLEVAIDADDDLKCSAEDADALFDFWVNTCPNQGSRTIRTE